ncbi:transketolase [Ponticoccus sp. SC2-23]|nr:transketolase [Ponticoccus sp. SC6-9]MBM1223098.1 transketolase [Ponticoccus sp. SC6-15]MBM1229643.1 transketolase [Ponticoccus sp. SC6-38]MBM1232064.1 transketolase [Ponticoccus sp. SC6-45]MBM1237986.1 transketolase [Ponticoccus sp. SC6-49]MBM1241075.1 transketolase [Ponticoccus sp. SC2-64]MBM1245588.1 transketolase [Ponticoccus sp. SC6-42]MBM1250066.1 transketolase [Ponticoccus sp. SC6-33]MBM1255995.1 transketolase [Ponticoccus sp. SC6-60]MBM1260501.1 transketolase [Ponticoccus sp. SC
MDQVSALRQIEQRLLWLSCWMIHHANHIRPKADGAVKVGGHQASCASMVSIMTALYFHTLRPEDRVAVKPHAAPLFHAMLYLMGNQSRAKLENFRGFGGAQSYPSRTKDVDDVDFSTGSVGLGVAITAFASIMQDYIGARGWTNRPEGRMVALVGDAELDEGNVYECLQEGWKHDLRNCWWIIDYNRQSLDGVVHEGLWQRIEAIFGAFGWRVVRIKHGALQRAAFEEPGGAVLRDWIDSCPNDLFSALTFKGGAAWRDRLMDDIGDQGAVSALLGRRSDDELADLMTNLGGQCVETMAQAFDDIDDDRPTAFLAYTIKGWGTPLAGHKDNHGGLMTPAQMQQMQARHGVAEGQEWEPLSTVADARGLRDFLAKVPFFAQGARRHAAPRLPTDGPVWIDDAVQSTQAGFGKILDAMGRRKGGIADRILTMSPDVTISTGLSPWVNRRGLFARTERADTFRDQTVPSTQKWRFSPEGQHLELGIAEMNLFLALGAAGLSHSLFGARLLPVGTVYDPFVARGLDALNYACYQDARFMIVGTPSGVTLAPEGGAHQSVGTPLIGMSHDGLASFEPAYLDELSVIMDWSFDYMQHDGDGDPDEHTWLRDETGGAVYLRLSTRPLEQMRSPRSAEFARGVIDGAYWLRPPAPNTEVVIAYQGAVAPAAIEAAGRIGNDRRDVAVLAVTSADRLNAGWTAAQRGRMRRTGGPSHIERLLGNLPGHCLIVTVLDGHPATLSWLGAVAGHRVAPLGVEHFGQTGTIEDLHAHFRIDADAIVDAAATYSTGPDIRLRSA